MRRRALLAGLTSGVATFAGCMNISSEDSPHQMDTATNTTVRRTTETATQTSTRTTPTQTYTSSPPARTVSLAEEGNASVVDLATVDRTVAVNTGVRSSPSDRVYWRSFRTTATANHPVIVNGVVHNGSEEPWTVRIDGAVPFTAGPSDPPRPLWNPCGDPPSTPATALVAAPTGTHDLVSNPPVIYRARDGLWRTDVTTLPRIPGTVTLSPGQRLYGETALVGRRTGTGSGRPPGWYRFHSSGSDERVVTDVAVWPTSRSGPGQQSRFDGRSVPPLQDEGTGWHEAVGDGPIVWYHGASDTTRTYLVPTEERTTLPATIGVSFCNLTRHQFRRGLLVLLKRHLDQWTWIRSINAVPAPPIADPRPDVHAVDAVCWRIRLTGGTPPETPEYTVDGVVGNLESGTYALVFPHPVSTDDGVGSPRRSGALLVLQS